jgi:zinc protease
MSRPSLRLNVILLSLLAVLIAAGARGDGIAADQQLPRDPNNVYGQFDNGVKYIIRRNANPPGKVALYLHVRTGALNETEKQNGLAHFLEHMAFKGSAHFGPMKLIPLLSHLGMTFGADTNAHTNLWETVFKLTMPDTKPQTIDTALTIFSDYANELGLYPIQIESERRVILEESRARKSAGQRLNKEINKQLYAGTRLAVHDVIGDEGLIKTFPQAEFQDYWNTWYRPENMTLIVVGDIDPDKIIAKAKEKLGTFTARAPAREPIKAGLKPFESPRALVLTDPEQVFGEVNLICMKAGRPPITTFSQYRREMMEGIAEWIVNRRISNLISQGNAPFREASVGTGRFLNEGFEVSASAKGEPKDWNRMLDALVAELNRAIDHGFTAGELDLARRDELASAQWAVKTESSRDSTQIVSGFAGAVGLDRPIMSAQQRLDLMNQVLDGLTVDELHKIFVEDFATKSYAYVLEMPASMKGLPSNEEILAAASAAWAKKTEAPPEIVQVGSILPSEPEAGKVVSQETDKDLGLTTAVFADGVVLHHKFSDYKKDQVLIQITLPGGEIEETADNKGISSAASVMLERPATSRFTSTQLRDTMTGRNVDVSGGIGLDTMTIRVNGSPADLPLGLQLARAVLTDGILEQSALDDWKKNSLKMLEEKKTLAQGRMEDIIGETLDGGDVRLVPLTEEIVNRQQRDSAQAWFRRIASHSAIEVAVVGDIQLDDCIGLIAKYIGSLPKREGTFAELNSLRTLKRDAGPFVKTVHFKGITPKALVMAGYVGCNELDPDRRPLTLAGRVLSERMIQRIRMQDRLVYSIQCQSSPGRGIPGMGLFFASAPTDPQNAGKLAAMIQEMLKTFAHDGPSEDELATAKRQIANQLDSQMKEPEFWIVQIGEMTYRGRSLDDIKQIPTVFQTFTVDQVRDVARKYVKDDGGINLEAIPDIQGVGTTVDTQKRDHG